MEENNGVTEIVEESEDDQAKNEEDELEGKGLLWRITHKIKSIPPLRLILIVLAAYYLIKNWYITHYESPAPAAHLPPDHDKRMAEQRVKNWERVMETAKYSLVILIPYLIVRHFNVKAERQIALERERVEKEERKLNRQLEKATEKRQQAEKVIERKKIEEIMLGGLKKQEEKDKEEGQGKNRGKESVASEEAEGSADEGTREKEAPEEKGGKGKKKGGPKKKNK